LIINNINKVELHVTKSFCPVLNNLLQTGILNRNGRGNEHMMSLKQSYLVTLPNVSWRDRCFQGMYLIM